MGLQLANTEYKFSFFESIKNIKEAGAFDINQLVEAIKYGYFSEPILHLRETQDKKIKTDILPCVTLSGQFTERKKTGLVAHSGLIQIDIDEPEDAYERYYEEIIKDAYTYVAFRSTRGKGLKIIVKIAASVETHLEQYHALEKYYRETYKITIDKSCKDVGRAMLLSHDPEVYCNPFSEVFEECYLPPKPQPIQSKVLASAVQVNCTCKSSEEIVRAITDEVRRNHIDLTDSYDTWLRVAFALSNTLGEAGREYFHLLSDNHAEYDRLVCDAFYTGILRRGSGSISLGTLITLARLHNINVQLKQNVDESTQEVSAKKSDQELFHELKKARLKLAVDEGKPAYMIFNDETLQLLVSKRPTTSTQLLAIKGVGRVKAEAYGDTFVSIIKQAEGTVETKPEYGFELEETVSKTKQFSEEDEALFERLRDLRNEIAYEEELEKSWVFTNATLKEIAKNRPQTKKEFLKIRGVGNKKLEWYGELFLEEINDFELSVQ